MTLSSLQLDVGWGFLHVSNVFLFTEYSTSNLPYFNKNLKSWWVPVSLSEWQTWKVFFYIDSRFQFIDFLSFVAMTLHAIRIEGSACLATSDKQVQFSSTFGDLDDDLYSAVHQLE